MYPYQTVVTTLTAILVCGVRMLSGVNSSDLVGSVTKLTLASNTFSQKLYQEIGVNKPNAIFSPLSAHTVLSLGYMGAGGLTAKEMKSVLQLHGLSDPHKSYKKLIQDLNTVNKVHLFMANALFVNPSASINLEYERRVVSYYDAQAGKIDLQTPGGPETPINKWVAEKTENKITSILPSGSLDNSTVLLLLNTVFFNGIWYYTFDDYLTTNGSFYTSEASSVQVDFMHQVNNFPLKQDAIPGVDVLGIPFRNPRFALYVALPRSINGLSNLETYVTENSENLDMLFEKSPLTKVDLYLPKFKLTSTIDLVDPLTNLGMPTAFSDAADFSGISPSSLKISKVVQKATIEVGEEGTVAAASTAVRISFRRGFYDPSKPVVFKADHPFLFFLRDNETKQILFQGKLGDPSAEESEI